MLKNCVAFATVLLYVGIAFAGLAQPITSTPAMLIPAAGSTPGANGTFFRTDITLANMRLTVQNVAFQWLPAAASGSPATKIVTIGAGGGISGADFIQQYFGATGLGALLITGVTTDGSPDPNAQLFATVRIWTQQPGTAGTTSQSFPALPLSAVNTPGSLNVYGVGGPAAAPFRFRANIGIVNLDPQNSQTYSIEIPTIGVPSLPTTVTVPPMSMQQISIGSGPGDPTLGLVRIHNDTPDATRSARWTAYGSTVDEVTGDAWSEIGVPFP